MSIHETQSIRRSSSGVTVIELMVALAVIAALTVVATSSMLEGNVNAQLKGKARALADEIQLARAEAVRTGDIQVLFFGNPGTTDPSGNPVQVGGSWVPLLRIHDGPEATANCRIDAGEVRGYVRADANGVNWGVSRATTKVPADAGTAPFATSPPPPWDGATFVDASGTKINWMMFRPDGIPVGFSGAMGSCGTVGTTGQGGGALYLTNGERDYAVVVTPLGGVRVHVWDGSNWSS